MKSSLFKRITGLIIILSLVSFGLKVHAQPPVKRDTITTMIVTGTNYVTIDKQFVKVTTDNAAVNQLVLKQCKGDVLVKSVDTTTKPKIYSIYLPMSAEAKVRKLFNLSP